MTLNDQQLPAPASAPTHTVRVLPVWGCVPRLLLLSVSGGAGRPLEEVLAAATRFTRGCPPKDEHGGETGGLEHLHMLVPLSDDRVPRDFGVIPLETLLSRKDPWDQAQLAPLLDAERAAGRPPEVLLVMLEDAWQLLTFPFVGNGAVFLHGGQWHFLAHADERERCLHLCSNFPADHLPELLRYDEDDVMQQLQEDEEAAEAEYPTVL